jgi:hypothetical protein
VKETDYQTAERTKFMQTPPTLMESGIDTSKPYNSARRVDWSNPQATPMDQAEFNDAAVWPTPPPANK